MIHGLGASAATILSGYMNRAAAGLIQLITDEQRKFAAKPSFGDVVELTEFAKVRIARAETSQDRFGAFKKASGTRATRSRCMPRTGSTRHPSETSPTSWRTRTPSRCWVRLQTGDLPILWSGAREYNPDFIAVDTDDTHWVIEVKMDKEMRTAERPRQAGSCSAVGQPCERRRQGRHRVALPAALRDRRQDRQRLMGSPDRAWWCIRVTGDVGRRCGLTRTVR